MNRMRTRGKPGDPCTILIFGASGDLAKRKLFPALLNLRRDGLLSDDFAVLGLATSEMTSEAFRDRITDDLRSFAPQDVDSELWKWLCERTYYAPGNFRAPESYARLAEELRTVRRSTALAATSSSTWPPPPISSATSSTTWAQAGLTAERRGLAARGHREAVRPRATTRRAS